MSDLSSSNSPKKLPPARNKSLGLDEWIAIIVAVATLGSIFFSIVTEKESNTDALASLNGSEAGANASLLTDSDRDEVPQFINKINTSRFPQGAIAEFETQPKSISDIATIPVIDAPPAPAPMPGPVAPPAAMETVPIAPEPGPVVPPAAMETVPIAPEPGPVVPPAAMEVAPAAPMPGPVVPPAAMEVAPAAPMPGPVVPPAAMETVPIAPEPGPVVPPAAMETVPIAPEPGPVVPPAAMEVAPAAPMPGPVVPPAAMEVVPAAPMPGPVVPPAAMETVPAAPMPGPVVPPAAMETVPAAPMPGPVVPPAAMEVAPAAPMPGPAVPPAAMEVAPAAPMPGPVVPPAAMEVAPAAPMPGPAVPPAAMEVVPAAPMPGPVAPPAAVEAAPAAPMPGPVVPPAAMETVPIAPEPAMMEIVTPGAGMESENISAAEAKEKPTKLSLPIAFNSQKGEKLLVNSDSRADYLPLTMQFVSQDNLAYCGVASAVMVLNALKVPAPNVPELRDRYRFFTQKNVFDNPQARKVILPETVATRGMTLKQLTRFVRSHGTPAEAYYSSYTGLDEFRQKLVENLEQENNFVLVNYLRSKLGQRGGGHISPIAAYDKESDRFLILDVSRYKHPPVWVTAEQLWEATNTVDRSSGKTRGFVWVGR